MKPIEFITIPSLDNIIANPMVIDASDISSITAINSHICHLITKQNNSFFLLGKHKHLINRWLYAFIKKFSLNEDVVLRPSLTLLYNIEHFECDTIHLDKFQAFGFLKAYEQEHNLIKFSEETQTLILEAKTILEKN